MPSAVRDLFRRAAAELEKAGVEAPAAEAGALVAELCAVSPAESPLSPRPVTAAVAAKFETILRRRLEHEPWQYIFGKAYFYDLELEVTPAVLIPRPETELLVDRVLELLPATGTLLDLGTGSGAIALAVAKHRPRAHVTGAELSPEALEVAGRNLARLGFDNVELVPSDLFSALEGRRFDVIAANLPYVPEEDRPLLAPEVARHEPATALFASEGGLAAILRALDAAAEHLVPGGHVIFELDPRQATRIARRLEERGFVPTIRRDLTGRERFVEGALKTNSSGKTK